MSSGLWRSAWDTEIKEKGRTAQSCVVPGCVLCWIVAAVQCAMRERPGLASDADVVPSVHVHCTQHIPNCKCNSSPLRFSVQALAGRGRREGTVARSCQRRCQIRDRCHMGCHVRTVPNCYWLLPVHGTQMASCDTCRTNPREREPGAATGPVQRTALAIYLRKMRFGHGLCNIKKNKRVRDGDVGEG